MMPVCQQNELLSLSLSGLKQRTTHERVPPGSAGPIPRFGLGRKEQLPSGSVQQRP